MIFNTAKSSKSINKEKEKFVKYYNINNDTSPYSNNLLNIPKQNKNMLCLTPHNKNTYKNNYFSTIKIAANAYNNNNNNNVTIMQRSPNINGRIDQYQLHPFRRLNLKLIGENIKQKLIEMNEKTDGYESDKTINSQKDTKLLSNTIKKQNSNNITNSNENIIILNLTDNNENDKKGNSICAVQKPNFELFEKNEEIPDNLDNTNLRHSIKISIPKIKIPKKKDKNNEIKNNYKENNKNIKNKYIIKYRKLRKKKLIYDSMGDNESEEEDEGNVINPETKLIFIFDLFIVIIYFYTFFILTMDIAQTECFCSYKHCTINDIIFYFNDILYILDLIISFFRSYYNFEYKLVKSNNLIIKNYLSGDFFLDLIEAIPIFTISKYICYKNKEYFNCYQYEMPSIFFMLKSFLILKILKIIKILGGKKNQALDAFLELISENYTIERTTLLIIDSFIFIGIIHCFVCFHIFIGKHTYSNWLIKSNAKNESIFNLYIESLYFLVTTLTTVGYGDITCSSFGERIFQIIILAIGSIFYSYIISTISNYIKNDSHAKINYNNDLNILENIRVAYPNMKYKLYKNIHKFLESKSNSQEKYDINSLIETLPFTLKNTILFTMYKSAIQNFKFFKKNDNSEFIAQVLNNFIPIMSKKNEFLIYEGEIIEEMIFIKDGRISLNAAINLENPIKSISKYVYEKFSPFTSEEEKKLFENRLNKSGYVSAMNGEITYDKAKIKLNNAFKTIKTFDENYLSILNNEENNNNVTDSLDKFDINGGTIKNEEGNYQYLKIIDIRKNEHFGCVYMTLKRPSPLSLQVKSKYAELFYFKKEEAIATSKSYPNIWRKLYSKEFHNLRQIKKLTFKALRKYININQILLDLNLDDAMAKNDLTINDLNELEKSIYTDKSIALPLFQKISSSQKKISTNNKITNNKITKFKTMNSEFDKKAKRLTLSKINVQNHIDQLSFLKNKIKGGNLYSNSIIYCNSNKEKIASLWNNAPFISNRKIKQKKVVHFADDPLFFKSGKNEGIIKDKISFKSFKNNNVYSTEENETEKKIKIKKRIQKEKLKKLKNFLINCQKKLKTTNDLRKSNEKDKNNDILVPNDQCKKSILKDNNKKAELKYQNNLITENQVVTSKNDKNAETNNIKNNIENIQNNINNHQNSLIKDLKNYCNEELNFSFCSINDDKNTIFEELSISNDIRIEILSSYTNLNQISKGQYISDLYFQKKIKLKLKKYYLIEKYNNEHSLSLKSLKFSSDSEKNRLTKNKKIPKKNKKTKDIKNKKSSKNKLIKNNSNSYLNAINLEKKSQLIKSNKLPTNRTDIIEKGIIPSSSIEGKNLTNKITSKKDFINQSNNKNNTFYQSFKDNNVNSIKTNKSSDNINDNNIDNINDNHSSFYSKKIKKKKSQNDSFTFNIKKNKHIYNKSEAEFEINEVFNNKNHNNATNNIYNENNKNTSNKNNNNFGNIYKNNNHKKKYSINKNNKSKIINQILGINLPNSNIITNNITSTSNNNDNKDNFNTHDKINNIEASFSIYNIIQKNVNKNLNIIDSKEKDKDNNLNKSICIIY